MLRRLRKSQKQKPQRVPAADDASESAPEEVTTVHAKAIAQQEERSRSAAAARASQRVADVKQRRRDVAQQRTAQAVAKRKARAAVPVSDANDDAEETPSVAVAAAPARKANHQFLSDEIIAELARQEDERDGAADIDEERARTDAKRRKVKPQSRQVTNNLEVRVLPRVAVEQQRVAPEILAFKQKHFYGDRVKRVDERTLSRRRGPMPLFNIEKK